MALWAVSAGGDAAVGGAAPLAAALLARATCPALAEGAASGAGALAVARLRAEATGSSNTREIPERSRRGIAVAAAAADDDDDADFPDHPDHPLYADHFDVSGGSDAAGRCPGDALTSSESVFRASAGRLVGAALVDAGAAGAAALARCVEAFPRLAREGRATLGGTGAAAEDSARDAHAAAAAATAAWLAESAAKAAARGSLSSVRAGALAALAPATPFHAEAWGADDVSTDDLDRRLDAPDAAVSSSLGAAVFDAAHDERDGFAGAKALVRAAAARWTVASRREGVGDGGETDAPDAPSASSRSAGLAAATRDLSAVTAGVLDGVLGGGGGGLRPGASAAARRARGPRARASRWRRSRRHSRRRRGRFRRRRRSRRRDSSPRSYAGPSETRRSVGARARGSPRSR